MSFKTWLQGVRQTIRSFSRWREYGVYEAVFRAFGQDAYRSDVVRSCIRPLAEHTSKANARCTDQKIERMLNISPNMYMTGKDFLSKVRTHLELKNTAFIVIHRDDAGRPDGVYPVPYLDFEALEYSERLFVRFSFASRADPLVVAWEDLAVLRKDYNRSDIAGDDNYAILPTLEVVDTMNQGINNAVKSTANLRGILKSTKSMLSPEDRKKQKDEFIADYLNLENSSGIASLDATMEFSPISMNPVTASYDQRRDYRQDVERYFGISEAIITSDYSEQQMEAFYEARIEPFLVALSQEMTRKFFTERERAFGSKVFYESNRMLFASLATKLQMVALVDRALFTPNEYREMFGLAPYEGGDEFVLRLDTDKTGDKTGGE